MNHSIIFFKYKGSESKHTLGSVAPGRLVSNLFFLLSLFPGVRQLKTSSHISLTSFPTPPTSTLKYNGGPGNHVISSWDIASGCCRSTLIWRESMYTYKNKQFRSRSSWSLFPPQPSQRLCWLRRPLGFCFLFFRVCFFLKWTSFH